MTLKISLAPLFFLFRMIGTVGVLAFCATGIGLFLLAWYRAFGYEGKIWEQRNVSKDEVRTALKVKWSPRWATWLLGGKTVNEEYYSPQTNRYVDSQGRVLKWGYGKRLQRMEHRYSAIRREGKLEKF